MRYQICASWLKQENNMNNNNNMEKWALSDMSQKPCLLFPMQLAFMSTFQDTPTNP